MKILVTGGAGYIGSHTCVNLLNDGYDVVIVDDLSNSNIDVIDKINKITNKKVKFYQENLINYDALKKIFFDEKIDAVIHFAGFKAVFESVKDPLKYYNNNLNSTITLLRVMKEFNCKRLVFSSSATVYGKPKSLPICENFDLSTTNPYGTTKLMIENILKDLYYSDNTWSIVILRYFNPIGAHESGLLYENPHGIPNNLMPYIIKVANKELPYLNIFGNDYDTIDGTGVRDYIHVVDLARGHICAIKYCFKNNVCDCFNLGTGRGTSVLELVNAFSKVNNVDIPYVIKERREGDIDACYASCDKALKILKFKAEKDINDMCYDAYSFIRNGDKNGK